MALKAKYQYKHEEILRDARPWTTRMRDSLIQPSTAAIIYGMAAGAIFTEPLAQPFADLIFFFGLLYFWWLVTRPVKLPFKLPKSSKRKDPHDKKPNGSLGMADGILYLGNDTDTNEEIWFTNSDARTHCLYLGTTGSGKTIGLKSYAANALCWGSGFIYIDGKADTSLWSTLSASVRRFGRDDDILIMNYMTGNVSGKVPSNTLNPFSSGSASYLTNMLVSLMPESEGDNAMWKERAVALVSALMPCLVWKRENQNIPLSIGVIRQFLTFKTVIKLSRDSTVPDSLRSAVKAYLGELPGYDDRMFDDDGNTKQQPDGSMPDTSTPNQQHGYLSMQFTRSMQSLGDDYGFIFDTQAADVDMLDVVLNRRILIVLIPALEKSEDETANLGKIISSTLKGMMGATLGSTVEGEAATVIDNKPTNSATPFIAIFDEVGYYTAKGMAVMAAQARSLGFSLVFAGQDLPAMEKRVKEEARSITANCNIKLFGKLEDPTQTKEFFEKTVGKALVTEVSGFTRGQGMSQGYTDGQNASVQVRDRASYELLKGYSDGKAICAFGKEVNEIQVYYSDIGDAKAMRVHRFLPIPPPSEDALEALRMVDSVLKRLRNPKWNPAQMDAPVSRDIDAMAAGFLGAKNAGGAGFLECGISAVAGVAEAHDTIKPGDAELADEAARVPITAPPPTPAEKAAAETVRQRTGSGPLSWMEVIGGEAAESSPLDRPADMAGDARPYSASRPPPVVDAPATATASSGPTTWESLIGMGKELEASENEAARAAAQRTAEVAAAAALKGPLSWMDVIGAADTAPSVAPFITPAAPEAAAPMPWEAPAAQAHAAPAQKQPEESPPEGNPLAGTAGREPRGPLNWADVIGAAAPLDKGAAAPVDKGAAAPMDKGTGTPADTDNDKEKQ